MSLKYEVADDDTNAEDNESLPLLIRAKSTLLRPFRLLTSRPALRAYLTTTLLILTSLILIGLAITAYTLFYWNYVPRLGFSRTVHLQFDHVFPSDHARYDAAANPYGTAELGRDVVSGQRYDVSVVLQLPRTRENRAAGNFMVEAALYASGQGVLDDVKEGLVPGLAEKDNVLARSRRPGMLAYRSTPLEWVARALQLPLYLLGWRSESETLTVSLWEGVEFSRGWRNVPATMRVELQSSGRMQVYGAKVEWRARFRGLRWVMYNHRLISAIVFVTAFWATEMAFAGLAWATVRVYLQTSARPEQSVKAEAQDSARVKQEQGSDDARGLEMSDTERTFPSSSKQQPLRYQSPREEEGPKIKQEFGEGPTKATEADDEDEDVDFVDSGLGTSMDSSAARKDSVRRRRSRPEGRDRDDG